MYKRILTVQDISCLGQCSTTVALPVFSACGHECCILPTALLSTHTGGFTGNTFLDLSAEMPRIMEHWAREGLRFDLLHTAYLGRLAHLDLILRSAASCLLPAFTLMDPAMGNRAAVQGFNRNMWMACETCAAAPTSCCPTLKPAARRIPTKANRTRPMWMSC